MLGFLERKIKSKKISVEEVNAQKEIEKKRKLKQEKEKAIVEVMKRTGWERGYTEQCIADARRRTRCAYKEFVMYKFYALDARVQEQLFLIYDSKRIAAKYDTDKQVYKMLTNKAKTNQCFDAYLKRPWCVNTEISFKNFKKIFMDSNRIIYKPLDGNRGFGIKAFDIVTDNMKDIFNELRSFPIGVIEEYVVQHKTLSALAPASVNTLRIVSLSSNSKPVTADGKKMDIAYAALRIGGGNSVVDNFHSGGMVAAVDLNRGELVTDGADMEGNVYRNHPLTGVPIKGFQIPFFEEAIQLVKDAQEESQIAGYLGWDIAITEEGPVLIEINLKPGAVLLTTPYIAERKGMKHVMEKYLECDLEDKDE